MMRRKIFDRCCEDAPDYERDQYGGYCEQCGIVYYVPPITQYCTHEEHHAFNRPCAEHWGCVDCGASIWLPGRCEGCRRQHPTPSIPADDFDAMSDAIASYDAGEFDAMSDGDLYEMAGEFVTHITRRGHFAAGSIPLSATAGWYIAWNPRYHDRQSPKIVGHRDEWLPTLMYALRVDTRAA